MCCIIKGVFSYKPQATIWDKRLFHFSEYKFNFGDHVDVDVHNPYAGGGGEKVR